MKRRVQMRLAYLNLLLARMLRKPRVRSIYGIMLKANYDDTTFVFYTTGAYRFFYADALAAIDHDFYFLDIGSNQGLYSILAAKNPHCHSVFAFEPVSGTADIFEENARLNGVDAMITLTRKAISDQPGCIDIHIPEGHSGGASIAKGNQMAGSRTERVEMTDYNGLNALPINRSRPIHVKIDVEGHEGSVMEELFRSNLADRIVEVFYECDERWMDKAPIEQLLVSNGFDLQKIGKGRHYDVMARRQT